jgi:hypothetical protein
MNPQRDRKNIIKYPPEMLKSFEVCDYEWIDNLNFTIDPKECLDNFEEYVKIAKERFLEAGWDGDGEIELMWIPPFMFKGVRTEKFTVGVTIWHVKQKEDGFSWLLSPMKLPDENELPENKSIL